MKKKNLIVAIISFLILLNVNACDDSILDTPAYSEMTPASILSTESGISAVLNSAYSSSRGGLDYNRFHIWGADLTTGLAWSRGGSIEVWFEAYMNFTWDSNHRQLPWSDQYAVIRDVNIILANINDHGFDSEFVSRITGEARFLRAFNYWRLYKAVGPVPLITKPDEIMMARASDDEMRSFIESELQTTAQELPISSSYGQANRGAALGVLAKYYLNTMQWDEVVNVTQQIMDMNRYELLENYADVFAHSNTGNSEILWAHVYSAPGTTHNTNATIFPTDFPLPYPNNSVFAAETYFFDNFVNSFEENDTRRDLFYVDYVSTSSGETVIGLGNDMSLPGKYPFDPNSSSSREGADIPIVRYADILLSRAEALNELNGPTQESIDLINQVRARAGVSDLILSDFTQDSLRDQILQERLWELWWEGTSREDYIRHGIFISNAQERGINAQPHHVLFPIIQSEIDANPLIEQNEGY